jgi:hypothetical protein
VISNNLLTLDFKKIYSVLLSLLGLVKFFSYNFFG